MTYATIDTSQGSFGVKVPTEYGSWIIHYADEVEALEVAASLNKAYTAGYKQGVSDTSTIWDAKNEHRSLLRQSYLASEQARLLRIPCDPRVPEAGGDDRPDDATLQCR